MDVEKDKEVLKIEMLTPAHRLTEEKTRRKRADFLLNHLSNRLNFLKREEGKALLSVSQARQKAYQIYKVRHLSSTHKEQISLCRRQSLQLEEQQREINAKRATVASLRRVEACRLVQVQKRRDVRAISRMKEVLENRGREMWRAEMIRRRTKVSELRRASGDVPLSIDMLQKEKQQRVSNWRQFRLFSEIQQRDLHLASISALEQQRLSLTQRLISVSTEQTQAVLV